MVTAIGGGGPVVCLETSVIGQGLPHPRNVECIDRMAGAIRDAGAVPAWVGVLDGDLVVGLTEPEHVHSTRGRLDWGEGRLHLPPWGFAWLTNR